MRFIELQFKAWWEMEEEEINPIEDEEEGQE